MDVESFNRNPAHAATSAKASVPPPKTSTSRLIVQLGRNPICRFQLASNWPVIFNLGAHNGRSIGGVLSGGRIRRVRTSYWCNQVTPQHDLVHCPRLAA